jgi:hypothetical protein
MDLVRFEIGFPEKQKLQNNKNNLVVNELGHLLTRSGHNHPKVS